MAAEVTIALLEGRDEHAHALPCRGGRGPLLVAVHGLVGDTQRR
jgi:hypothetical protein